MSYLTFASKNDDFDWVFWDVCIVCNSYLMFFQAQEARGNTVTVTWLMEVSNVIELKQKIAIFRHPARRPNDTTSGRF